MNRPSLIVVALFVLTLAAGWTAGLLFGQWRPSAAPPGRSDSILARDLNLTPAQQEQMKQIWSREGDRGRGFDQHRALQKQRDDAVRALLSPEKQAELDRINENYRKQVEELGATQRKAFETAVEKTKQILTPEQRVKYEEFLRKRGEGHRRGGSPGAGGPAGAGDGLRFLGTRPGTAAATRPAAEAEPKSN